jgi:hypothetical protein
LRSVKHKTLAVFLLILTSVSAVSAELPEDATVETESGVEIGNQVETRSTSPGLPSRLGNFVDENKHYIPGVDREPATKTELIMEARVDATQLSQKEVGAVSGVPGVKVRLSDVTVGEVVEKARDRRAKTNWNKYAQEAVNSMGVYDHSSRPIEVDSPADVSVNGHSFVVSSDGYVFTEGQGWAAPHCWDGLNYQPPEFDESLVPQVDPNLSTTSPGEECPSWVSESNLEWLPQGEELARPETYCADILGKPTAVELEKRPSPASTDKLERIYYEGGENAVVKTECVREKLVPMCGKGDPNNYCKKMNVKLCNYFDANCGKAEDVTIEEGMTWTSYCGNETSTDTLEGKKTCITERIGPECAGQPGTECTRTMSSLCSYLGLGYNQTGNVCEVGS